jgi:hypothetical protein
MIKVPVGVDDETYDGDSVIFFPQSNVVHMGDDFVTYGFPFVDLRSGGSVEGATLVCT